MFRESFFDSRATAINSCVKNDESNQVAKKRTKTGGRQKGTKNRIDQLQDIAANATPKYMLHLTFLEMGGWKGYLDWAKKNKDKFYNQYFRSAPGSKATEGRAGGDQRNRDDGSQPVGNVEIEDFTK